MCERSDQVIQNKVARSATTKSWSSVKQLAMYHTVLVVYKVLEKGFPVYLANMFSTEYERSTRQNRNL